MLSVYGRWNAWLCSQFLNLTRVRTKISWSPCVTSSTSTNKLESDHTRLSATAQSESHGNSFRRLCFKNWPDLVPPNLQTCVTFSDPSFRATIVAFLFRTIDAWVIHDWLCLFCCVDGLSQIGGMMLNNSSEFACLGYTMWQPHCWLWLSQHSDHWWLELMSFESFLFSLCLPKQSLTLVASYRT